MQEKQDKELLEAFHLMDCDERALYLEAFRNHTLGRKKKITPTLLLVLGGAATTSDGKLRSGLG